MFDCREIYWIIVFYDYVNFLIDEFIVREIVCCVVERSLKYESC